MLCCFTERSCALNLDLSIDSVLPCLWLPALPRPVPGGSIFLASPSISHHQRREDTVSPWSPSHTCLRSRCWAAKGGGWCLICLFRSRCSVTAVAASLATISVSKIQNKKENWGFLLSRGFFKTCKVIRILLWHRCISVYWQKQRTPPAYRWASVVSWKFTQWCNVPFPPSETGQQWEGGWGLHHIISPQRGRPAAYSCLMAPSCHMASQAAATQERQMLWLHKDL